MACTIFPCQIVLVVGTMTPLNKHLERKVPVTYVYVPLTNCDVMTRADVD